MDIGELFWIKEPGANLEQKVLWAADNYQRKYGKAPNLCLVHPSLLNGKANRLGSVRLEAKKSILPNYLWIGVAAETAKPTAN
ncbi:MAG TPA: hypothetical protein VLK33_04460 [Terriglobales bacterium]|nr:hypothetical protein [Terriglobales bacterium]